MSPFSFQEASFLEVGLGEIIKYYLGEKEFMTRPAGAAIFPFVTA